MGSLKVTVLVENTVGVPAGLLSEWGLSMLLDFGDEKILFDTGEQGNLVANAHTLGHDLRQINRVVLSHGHYDHTGGLLKFLLFRGKVPVYAHPDLFCGHYARKMIGQENQYIGVPYCYEQILSAGAEFHWHKDPVELRPGLWLSGEIPRKTDFEKVDGRMVLVKGEQTVPDAIADDFSLFYVTEQGLVILLGCAHSGLVNIIEHAKQVTGESRVKAIIGGTHLGPADPEQQRKTINYLHGLNLSCLAPNHCTGLGMTVKLAAEFPKIFTFAAVGTTLVF
jgi:7,8-dihydropterin-6-yl-methyl-4-(beta-D-ribofuranosyl)aminobenzene 5'-phosphate synthase